MFKAKHSNHVVTQYEHLKFAGALALLWGNDEFETPPCRFESFVKGVALHDRGYGFFDNLPIGEASLDDWLDVSRKTFFAQYEDKIADLIVKHHILRLVSWTDHQDARVGTFIQEMQDSIDSSLHANQLDQSLFTFIDRITDFCDRVSFDFCFQNYGTHSINVQKKFSDAELTPLKYTIAQDNTIEISPWPLRVDHHTDYLIAYNAEGFPEKLEPEILSYSLVPG